jgi:hypothetical protein
MSSVEEIVPHSETAVVFLRDTDEAREARLLLDQSSWEVVVISEPLAVSGKLIIVDEQLLPALHEEAVNLLPGGRLIIVANDMTGKASGPVAPEVYMLYRPYTPAQLQLACQVD